MSNQKDREAVKAVYPDSKRWGQRVDAMSDEQFAAIFMRLKAAGKI